MSKVEIGHNRTGVGFDPRRAATMRIGAAEFPPTSNNSGDSASRLREAYAGRDLVGTVPATGPMGKPASHKLAPLVDKLGARLAFERAGVRLYDGLLTKLETNGRFDGGPRREDLERIRTQEHQHFSLLWRTILALGADPTALTPSADLQLEAGKGVGVLIRDPRTSLLECLEAILIAELADEVSWESLIALAEVHGVADALDELRRALEHEHEHVELIRGWIAAGHGLSPTRH